MADANNNYCTLYVMRHGETKWNKEQRLLGHVDSPLTEEGKIHLKNVADELKHVNFDAAYSSDLSRAKNTAEIIKLERDLMVQTKEALREKNFGKWDGKLLDEYRNDLKEVLEAKAKLSMEESFDFVLDESIETDRKVIDRMILTVREIALAHLGQTVLIVTHGACVRLLLTRLGYLKENDIGKKAMTNGGYAIIESDGIDFFVKDVVGIKMVDNNSESLVKS